MIGPGGLLLIVPHVYMQFQFEFCWWGCQKKETAKLRHFYFTIESYIQSTVGDALTNQTASFSLYSHNMKLLFLDLQNFFLLEPCMDLPPLSLQFCMSFNRLGMELDH